MSEQGLPPRAEIQRLIEERLQGLAVLRGPDVEMAAMQARSRLKAWQVARLAQTHAHWLQSDRYGPAARFFLEDLYGPKDHRARDADLARVLPRLLKLLPLSAQWTLAQALHMDVLSESLDADVTHHLRKLGAMDEDQDITQAHYLQAYRACGRQEDRSLQLDLVMHIGRSLDQLTRLPMLASSLKLMKKPAELAGLSELHGFLQRGYSAFAQMKGAEEFLERTVQLERELMLSWFRP